MSNEIVQISMFDYSVFDQDTVTFLQETEDKIIGRTRRAAEDNGKDLLKVKERIGRGHFLDWIGTKFGWSEDTAERQMNVALRMGEIPHRAEFEDRALYFLSGKKVLESARVEAKERAVSGEKVTLDVAKEIAEAHKRAKEAEQKAKDAQDQLGIFQAHSQLAQGKNDELTNQITELEEKLRTAQTPERVEVIPQETLDKIENLEALVKKLNEKNKFLHDETDKLTDELRKQRDANEARRKQEQYEFEIKNGWKKSTDTLYKALSQFVGSIPSPIAVQVFEGDEWARYDQIEQALKHFYEAFAGIKATRYSDQFVESSVVESPVIYEGSSNGSQE